MTEHPHTTEGDIECSCNPLILTVEPGGSISRVAGGTLEEPVDTGASQERPQPLVYLPMDCPVCGRHRVEWDGTVLRCEKCTTSSEWDGFTTERYASQERPEPDRNPGHEHVWRCDYCEARPDPATGRTAEDDALCEEYGCEDRTHPVQRASQERPSIDVERQRLIEALRDEQQYAGALSDALLRIGHHPFGHHESPTSYDGDSPRACSFPQCLARLSPHNRGADSLSTDTREEPSDE